MDGSANPYLAAAACSATGLDGIERGLDPGEPNTENLYTAVGRSRSQARGIKSLPATLLDAVGDAASATTCCATGSATPAREDYLDYFAKTKREEFRAYHAGVSRWEVDRYLTLF